MVDSDGADVMSASRLFQTRGPTTWKARMSIVDSLNGGTTRRLVPAEQRDIRRDCQPGRSATLTTGPRYSGAISCITLNGDLVDDALRDTQPVQLAHQLHDRSVEVYKSTVRLRFAPT